MANFGKIGNAVSSGKDIVFNTLKYIGVGSSLVTTLYAANNETPPRKFASTAEELKFKIEVADYYSSITAKDSAINENKIKDVFYSPTPEQARLLASAQKTKEDKQEPEAEPLDPNQPEVATEDTTTLARKLKAIAEKYGSVEQPEVKIFLDLVSVSKLKQGRDAERKHSFLPTVASYFNHFVQKNKNKTNFKETFPVFVQIADDFKPLLEEAGVSCDFFNSHEYLVEANPTYKKNIDFLNTTFDKARGIYAKLEKLSPEQQKMYMICVYADYSFKPEQVTVEHKKAVLGIYHNDISYNNASAGKINQDFAKIMKQAKDIVKETDVTNTPMPRTETQMKIVNADLLDDI